MENIKVIYSKKLNRTTFKCDVCRKAWFFRGKESDLKVGDKLFLLNHDRSHK
jgi:hypothetical protein